METPTIELRPRRDWRMPLATAALVLLTLVAYIPAINSTIIWDDGIWLTNNPVVLYSEGLKVIWTEPSSLPHFYPFTLTSFWLEHRLFGLSIPMYHFDNVLLHAISAVILWLVLRRLGLRAAWLAAAVWAVHPLNVESVAWITERKNVLSGLFYLLAALSCLRFTGMDDRAAPANAPDAPARRWLLYAAALACFVLSLLAKTYTLTLPVTLLTVLWWKRGLTRRLLADAAFLAPMLVLGLILGLVTRHVEYTVQGIAGPDYTFTPLQHVLIAGGDVCFYIWKFLAPYPLVQTYGRWNLETPSPWLYAAPVAVVATLAATAWLAFRGKRWPLVTALCYMVALGPVLGFFGFYSMVFAFVADHYAYLATMVLAAAVAEIAVALVARAAKVEPVADIIPGRQGLGWSQPVLLAVVVLVGVSAAITARQATLYQDNVDLWSQNIRHAPDSWIAHYNLAVSYMESPRLTEKERKDLAEPHFILSTKLNPRADRAFGDTARFYSFSNRINEALPFAARAVELAPKGPAWRLLYSELLLKAGKAEDALAQATAAVQINPRQAKYYVAAGSAQTMLKRHDAALASFDAAIKLNPYLADAYIGKAYVFEDKGDLAAAAGEYEKAIAQSPHYTRTYNELGMMYGRAGHWKEAADAFTRGIKVDPNDPLLHDRLGTCYRQLGDAAAAQREWSTAKQLRLDPDVARQQMRPFSGE